MNKTKNKIINFSVAIIVLTLVLSACSTPAEKRRSTGATIDDTNIEIAAQYNIDHSDFFDGQDRIIAVSVNGRLLLAGEVSSREKKTKAGEIASKIKSVKIVYNELQIGAQASSRTRINDSFLTTKINASLVKQNQIEGLDSARINVTTSQGIVYLMGLVSRTEGDAVATVASNISGVKKVVKLLEYIE